MNFRNNFVLTSCAVLGAFFVGTTRAALKPTGFPQTFQDVSFSQRNQVKQAGYEPYKDASAYVIPKFIENDDEFYEQLCKRDKQECCRRRPDFKGCQPQIGYELYGGDDSKCNPKLPKSYRTDQGATISCVPTRNKSVFLGWCTDAARNPADCAMSQTIPVGEKDDKFFWAKWDCVAPAVKRGEQCACSDPNMDDNCMCSGVGMTESGGQCVCLANTNPAKPEARIENKKCVCIDSSMDINTNCTTPISTPSGCSDEDHMDENDGCKCIPKGKSHEEGGLCKCDDPNLDIDNNCEPGATPPAGKEYYIKQCRKKPGTGVCKTNNKKSISDCFMQCNTAYNRGKQLFLNNKIQRLVGDDAANFCSGSNRNGPHLLEFREPTTKEIKYYDEATAKAVFDAIRDGATPGEIAPPFSTCETSTNNWVLTLFKYDATTSTSTQIDEIKIGE